MKHAISICAIVCMASGVGFMAGRLSTGESAPGLSETRHAATRHSLADRIDPPPQASTKASQRGATSGELVKEPSLRRARAVDGKARPTKAMERRPQKLGPATFAPQITALHPRTTGAYDRELLGNAAAAYKDGDYPTTLGILLPLAQTGVPAAQVRLGLMLARDGHTYRNPTLAWTWLQLAQENGAEGARTALTRLRRDLSGRTRASIGTLLHL